GPSGPGRSAARPLPVPPLSRRGGGGLQGGVGDGKRPPGPAPGGPEAHGGMPHGRGPGGHHPLAGGGQPRRLLPHHLSTGDPSHALDSTPHGSHLPPAGEGPGVPRQAAVPRPGGPVPPRRLSHLHPPHHRGAHDGGGPAAGLVYQDPPAATLNLTIAPSIP